MNEAGTRQSLAEIIEDGDLVYTLVKYETGENVKRNFVARIQDGKMAETWNHGGTGEIPGLLARD